MPAELAVEIDLEVIDRPPDRGDDLAVGSDRHHDQIQFAVDHDPALEQERVGSQPDQNLRAGHEFDRPGGPADVETGPEADAEPVEVEPVVATEVVQLLLLDHQVGEGFRVQGLRQQRHRHRIAAAALNAVGADPHEGILGRVGVREVPVEGDREFEHLGNLVAAAHAEHDGAVVHDHQSEDLQTRAGAPLLLGGRLRLLDQLGIDAQDHRRIGETDHDHAGGVECEGLVGQGADDDAKAQCPLPAEGLELVLAGNAAVPGDLTADRVVIEPGRKRAATVGHESAQESEDSQARVGQRNPDRQDQAQTDAQEVLGRVVGQVSHALDADGGQRQFESCLERSAVAENQPSGPTQDALDVHRQPEAAQFGGEIGAVDDDPNRRSGDRHDAQIQHKFEVEFEPRRTCAGTGRRHAQDVAHRPLDRPPAGVGDLERHVLVDQAELLVPLRLGVVELQPDALIGHLHGKLVVSADGPESVGLDIESDLAGVVEQKPGAEPRRICQAALPVLHLGAVDDDPAVLGDGREDTRGDGQGTHPDGCSVHPGRADPGQQRRRQGQRDRQYLRVQCGQTIGIAVALDGQREHGLPRPCVIGPAAGQGEDLGARAAGGVRRRSDRHAL